MTGPGRIHWVSPLPPAPTDIAEYTRRLIPHLAARAELVLWTDAEAWEPGLEALAPPGRVRVRRFDPKAPLPFAADALGGHAGPAAVFFHMGNSWVFHGGILALAARQPGVLVLHDLALREALRDLVLNGRWPERRLREAARRWYGHEAQADIDALLAGRATGAADLARAPLWEAALGRATGVLTHTGPAADAVAARRAVPVYRLPLPFPAGDGAPNPERDGDRDGDGDGSGGGPLRLVQFGHVGPNRRLEQVFEAIARVKGRVAVEIDVFGKLWDEAHLARAAAKLGIAEHVRFRGFAPEVELDAALARAHCVTNLRQPSMGEASGSQLRIWRAAALSVVTDLGWYATLPEDCAVKLPAEDEAGALAKLLMRIDGDRGLCARIGAAGRARLETVHDLGPYADGILRIAAAEEDAARRLVAELASPLHSGLSGEAATLAATALLSAFGAPEK